jgi:D-alanine-D-alanine ligase
MWAANDPQSPRLRVAVLSGGPSEERAISLESGLAVARVLGERGHEVITIDPGLTPLQAAHFRDVDVAFLALHGRVGEDGQIQALLERMGILYTGSGPSASRLAFSKSAAKEKFFQSGVPTPDYVLVHESDSVVRTHELAERVGFPLVVKPDSQGSSLGVSIVHSPETLPEALVHCFRFDSFGLMEKAILGTEWTVGLLEDQPFPPIEIESPRAFFDFTAKYEDVSTAYRFEHSIPHDVVHSIIEAGRNAARSLGVAGLSRVDLRLDRQSRPWVLEVNTIPGLTDHSLVPKAAAHAGVELGDLCERCIEHCLAVAAANQRMVLRGPHWTHTWRVEAGRRKRA